MDREQLRAQAQQRRNQNDDEGVVQLNPTWDCKYCKRSFKLEKAFMKHHCEEKNRITYMQSVEGQNAYGYYGTWMRLCGRSVPPITSFIHSSFYTTFVKFAKHTTWVNMPAPEIFIRLMVAQKIQPTLWCRDNVYAMYMQHYDTEVSPETQFIESVDFLFAYSMQHDISIENSFDGMGVEKLLLNVQKRKLSPWFLAASGVFRTWLRNLPPDDSKRVEESVKVGALMIRIRSNPTLASQFGEFCKATKEFNL